MAILGYLREIEGKKGATVSTVRTQSRGATESSAAIGGTGASGREQWGSQLGFLIAAIGSAIGLGNIWRFPGVAYNNGGGAFMIPYVVALIAAGIPILFLDYALGHRFRGSPPAVFRRISKKLEFLGWWQVLLCFVIMTYYAVIIAWSLRYVFYSMNVAWGKGSNSANYFNDFIEAAPTAHYSLAPVWNVALPLAVVWIVVLVAIGRGVSRGIEVANKIFLPLLVILFAALVVRALTLPGATEGLNALWTPNFSALKDPKVWLAAFTQIFYSLSVAFGIMLTYASYLRRRSNLVGTGLVASFANSSFEVLAGFGVFATLGFMAAQQHISVAELKDLQGIKLSFITFPTVISQMPSGAIFGVLFFLSLTFAGITSLISLVQVVAAGIAEKFDLKPAASSMVVGIPAAVVSLMVFGTKSGIYSLDVVDAYINAIGVVASAVLVCLITCYGVRNLRQLQRHLNFVSESGNFVGAWWRWLVGVVVPVFLSYVLISGIIGYIRNQYDAKSYTRGFENVFGWGSVAVVFFGALILTLIRWRTPVDDFEPLSLNVNEPRSGLRGSAGSAQKKASADGGQAGTLVDDQAEASEGDRVASPVGDRQNDSRVGGAR